MNEALVENYWLKLRIRSDIPALLTAIQRLLETRPPDVVDRKRVSAEVVLRAAKETPGVTLPQATPQIDQAGRYHTALADPSLRVCCNPNAAHVEVEIYEEFARKPEAVIDFCVLQPLHLILQQRGFFFLHASAVRRGAQAILISGPSGAGKSSIAVELAQHGFEFWADDDIFFAEQDGRVLVYPLNTSIGAKESLLQRYPALREGIGEDYCYGQKRRVTSDLLSVKNTNTTPEAVLLLLPQYRPSAALELTELQTDEWLPELADEHLQRFPEGPLKQAEAPKHFAALYALSRSLRAFRLYYHDAVLCELPRELARRGLS